MPKKVLEALLIIGLTVVVLLPRVFALEAFTTADEKRWVANTTGFVMHLSHGEWNRLLAQPHPGITTQWLGAPTVFSTSWAIRKLPLVIAQSVLVLLTGYIFARVWGSKAGILLIILLAINPVLVAHTRIYAMDSLLGIFTLLAMGCLLAWQKLGQRQYLFFAGLATAAAILSKLPGIVLIPYSLLFMTWHLARARKLQQFLPAVTIWGGALLLGAVLILPSLALEPVNRWHEFLSFFESGDYQELHHEGKTYYLRSLLFFSTPLHWLALLWLGGSAAYEIVRRKFSQPNWWWDTAWLVLFAILFTTQMTLGLKKGDRYILPVFLVADALVVLAMMRVIAWRAHSVRLAAVVLAAAIAWQAMDVARLHPYTLAYVNPLTKNFFGQRRLGWGEGLDLAAAYLNQKTGAAQLKVATYYPVEFSQKFMGRAIPAHQHDVGEVNYVVLYRAMLERGSTAWETDVWQQYMVQPPEKVIYLNGLPYVWIYARK